MRGSLRLSWGLPVNHPGRRHKRATVVYVTPKTHRGLQRRAKREKSTMQGILSVALDEMASDPAKLDTSTTTSAPR